MSLPRLTETEQAGLRPELVDPIEYRKSGLSLNHIVGCPLDCVYCVRHLFDNFSMRSPRSLMSDEEAVRYLVEHPYFIPNQTPLQLFNRATDPFLPGVKPHTFTVLDELDRRGLRNHLLVITRYRVTQQDCDRLNALSSLRVTLLVTYSGIAEKRIEPVASSIAEKSLQVAFENAESYRVLLYWRPIVAGLNDSADHIHRAVALSRQAHATVFSGLFYRAEIRGYYQAHGLPEPYADVARRKILPAEAEARVVEAFDEGASKLFRKTSCAVCYAHGVPDYNGHFGIREICDICPSAQVERCAGSHQAPSLEEVSSLAHRIGDGDVVAISSRAAMLDGFDEQQRYFLQHAFGFQFHDLAYPHRHRRHGRADMGWEHIGPDHT